MKASEVRERYLKFFESAPRNHSLIEPGSLVLKNDPTTLFTSSGMQPLVPYLLGEKHPKGTRLVNSQPSIRLQDIEEVGDNRHTTFFEMLGNWSLGDYFKKEQIAWFFEFLTKELGLSKDRLWVSVFEGNNQVPKDIESAKIWKKLGIPETRIGYYPAKKNWWSRNGTPQEMPIGDIGGPDSEVFFDFGEELRLHEKSPFKNEKCHMNCDCGRFLEVGNSVFMQYKKVGEDKLEELPNKNVDFGGGLERLVAATNNDPDVFKIDVFKSMIEIIQSKSGCRYEDAKFTKSFRIIADHVRAATFLLNSGVLPGNKRQEYVLRRLVRRAVDEAFQLNQDLDSKFFRSLIGIVIDSYPNYVNKSFEEDIADNMSKEVRRFRKTVKKGREETTNKIKIFQTSKLKAGLIIKDIWDHYHTDPDSVMSKLKLRPTPVSNASIYAGTIALDASTTYGFPIEEAVDLVSNKITASDYTTNYQVASYGLKLHRELSRTTSAGMFKGGLADHSDKVVRLHTATHLLQAALREVLGEHVLQRGQNITEERSRFDFSHEAKLTDEELKKVEDIVNAKIKDGLPVKYKLMKKEEAEKTGAIHLFGEKYGDEVNVYYIGNSIEDAYSKEFCGGPHVTNTSEIGHVTITKQKKIGSGLIRVYAEIS